MKNCYQWALAVTCMVLLAACSAQPPAGSPPPALSSAQGSVWPTPAPLGAWDGVTNLVVAPDGSAWVSYGDHDYNQPAGGGVTRYTGEAVIHFTTADGLPNDSVQALALAPDGTVWAGTLGCGIAHFDGQTWHDLHTDCATTGGHVVDFAFTPDGNTWIATGHDLARFDGRTWTRTGKYAGSAAALPDGSLWITGWEGREDSAYLARYDGNTWTVIDQGGNHSWLPPGPDGTRWVRITRGEGLPAIDLWDGADWTAIAPLTYIGLLQLSTSPDGTLWALTDQGLVRYDGTTWVYGPDALPGLPADALAGMSQLAFAPDGSLWLAGQGGRVAHYRPDQRQLTVLATPVPLPTPGPVQPVTPNGLVPVPTVTPAAQLPVTNLVTTPDGALWYAYGNFDFHPRGGGILRILQGESTHLFPMATVQRLAVAPDGTLWAGLGCQLAQFDGHTWQVLVEDCDLMHGNVIDVVFTPDGALWVTSGFALGRYAQGVWTIDDRLANHLAVTPDGALWLAAWEGTQRSWYAGRLVGHDIEARQPLWVNRLIVAPDSAVWAVADQVRLLRFAGLAWQEMAVLPEWGANDLAFASDGTLLAVTYQGLLRLRGTSWERDAKAPADLQQLAFAADGTLWLAQCTPFPYDLSHARWEPLSYPTPPATRSSLLSPPPHSTPMNP